MAIISEQCTGLDKSMTKFKISNNNYCHKKNKTCSRIIKVVEMHY